MHSILVRYFVVLHLIRLSLWGSADHWTFVVQLLWSYAKKSVALRIQYFRTLPKGVESHTVLVQDIPGVAFGTIIQRIESAAPKFIADKVCHQSSHEWMSCIYSSCYPAQNSNAINVNI